MRENVRNWNTCRVFSYFLDLVYLVYTRFRTYYGILAFLTNFYESIFNICYGFPNVFTFSPIFSHSIHIATEVFRFHWNNSSITNDSSRCAASYPVLNDYHEMQRRVKMWQYFTKYSKIAWKYVEKNARHNYSCKSLIIKHFPTFVHESLHTIRRTFSRASFAFAIANTYSRYSQ